MKRTIYIAFVAALSILASCTKQSIDVNPIVSGSSRSYIFFEPEVCNVERTKADLLKDNTLPSAAETAFGVIGYYGTTSLFSDIAEVKRTEEGGSFDYDGLVAWQGTTNHDFYAFYPYDLEGDVSLNVDATTKLANPFLTYTQPTTDAGMIDILTTKESTQKTSDNNVTLTFHHRLWALDVKITNSQATGLDSDDAMVSQPDLTINSVEIYVKDFPEVSYIPLDTAGEKITYGNDKITPETPYEMFISALNKTIKYGDTGTYGTLLFAPVPTNTFQYKLVINYTDSRGEASFTYPSSGYKTSSTEFEGGRVYSLTVNKKEDVFVVGQFHDSGNWTDVTVPHTFN